MTTMTTASPARIMEVGMAFWPAKVLLSAIELRLFSELGATSKTGDELQSAPGCTQDPIPISLTPSWPFDFLIERAMAPEPGIATRWRVPNFLINTVHSSWAAS